MSIPQALPWHARQWQSLAAGLAAGRLHHALLLQGSAGLGKRRFAERAAAALLCEGPVPAAERPCARCRSCALVAAGSHPDRLELSPAEDRAVIDVGQVRERLGDLVLTAHYALRRVLLVTPADALNRHAANTLLKTLEEPPGATVFLLVSARPATLPATVRSRCSVLRFQAPSRAVAEGWLREHAQQEGEATAEDALALLDWSGGSPLAALNAAREGTLQQYHSMLEDLRDLVTGELDPIAAAGRWRGTGLRHVLDWQLRAVAQVQRIRAGGQGADTGLALQAIGATLDLCHLDRLCDELYELRSALERQLNPAEQLALETLAVSWREAARPSA